MSGPVLLGLVLVNHYGYLRWPDRVDQQWHFYVASQALAAFALVLHVPGAQRIPARWARWAGVFGCWLGAIESTQAAACGAIEWGRPVEDELCTQALGPQWWGAMAAVSLAVAAMLAYHLWRARRG